MTKPTGTRNSPHSDLPRLNQPTVFVTGAGALVGQGILRSLRMSSLPVRIITGDPDHRATGHWLGDAAYTIPLADDPLYLQRLEEIVDREEVSLLLVGTDVELGVLSRARRRLEARYGVQVVVSPPDVVEIADDKWQTADFLRSHGFPSPRTALATDPDAVRNLLADLGLPLFVKPRRGARSVGAQLVRTAPELTRLCETQPDLIVQEYLPNAPGEYTAGCLVTQGRCAAVVVLRRDLRDGNTYRAYSNTSDRFHDVMAAMAERLGVDGPCNFQFRVRDDAPVVFEVNARFSGTTPIRAIFGFNEVEALVAHLLDGSPVAAPPPLRQGAVLRCWSDLFVSTAELDRFVAARSLSQPRAVHVPFRHRRRSAPSPV